ncbi:hypothetical protein CMQ_7124 [Grosmannia clavigera kw1407]|uniref:Duf862 domain containing protein n=1 Tax=Grosmannia clavigera (strain kw1407 / UAMH 11150) TaxID=655863 RepID=F0XNP8_GROCL|nr:uncharacterized protein CMQ_7124 [Grosmannia clavigera kw1407]EFX00122.1 hypothetical protein CMQ_7124 [Grosmannia clavigera kw1407]
MESTAADQDSVISDASSLSKRERMKTFLKEELHQAGDGLLKGKLKLEHSLGLGQKPNVIPAGEAQIHSNEERVVEIGWHPVAGLAGKWFAEKTGLGRLITEKINKYPDPTQHWAVLVGGYVHQLWMDESLDVIYINEELKHDEWHTYEVGKTRFNDEAIRQAGEMVIFNMRQKHPGYNLITNNCQNFALLMLDAVQIGKHRQFGSSFSIYQRATGEGTIADLFIDNPSQDEEDAAAAMDAEEAEEGEAAGSLPVPTEEGAEPKKSYFNNILKKAQKVMEDNTTKLDSHRTLH